MSFAIVTAALFLASITPETARFNIYQDGKKIGTEEFTITARRGGYIVEGRTELVGDPRPLTSRMETDDQLNPTSYEYQHGSEGSIRVKIGKPTSEYGTVAGWQESSIDFRFPEGGFIVDNNFFHHYLLLLYKVGKVGRTLPIFVPQDMRLGQASVRPLGNQRFELQMGDVKLEAVTDANGRLMRLEVPDAKVLVER